MILQICKTLKEVKKFLRQYVRTVTTLTSFDKGFVAQFNLHTGYAGYVTNTFIITGDYNKALKHARLLYSIAFDHKEILEHRERVNILRMLYSTSSLCSYLRSPDRHNLFVEAITKNVNAFYPLVDKLEDDKLPMRAEILKELMRRIGMIV